VSEEEVRRDPAIKGKIPRRTTFSVTEPELERKAVQDEDEWDNLCGKYHYKVSRDPSDKTSTAWFNGKQVGYWDGEDQEGWVGI
jgi:hypothetical protein